MAQEEKCTHIFFIDHDMQYPSDTLDRLLAHDKDIVGAAYNMRCYPLKTTVTLLDENGAMTPREKLPAELFRCEAVATGMMLAKMSVFDKVEKPWFAIMIDPETNELTITEDVYFCNQARKAGFEIWCDPTIPIGHIGEATY